MKHKYLLGIYFCVIGLFLYLFYAVYTETKEKAIAELNSRQTIHAKQAQKGIEDFFNRVSAFLTKISQSNHIVELDDLGRNEMDFALGFQPEAITAITRVDASGKITYSTSVAGDIAGRDISGQKHIQELMKTHGPVASDVFTAVQGYDAIALHVPLFKGNEFRGTIAALIDFGVVAKRFLQEIRIGETGYAWIISREGIELYCPVPGHTGKSVYENCKDFPTILSMVKHMVQGGQGTTTYLLNQVRDKREEVIKKHAVYMPIKVGDTFWSIVVASSEDEVLASLVSFKNKLILLVGLLFFCIVIFSYYGMKARVVIQESIKRKKIEQELRESEEKYRNILENIEDGYYEVDTAGNFTFFNKAMCRILGYSADELMGMNNREYMDEENAKKTFRAFHKVYQTGTATKVLGWKLIGKDGSEHYIETAVSLVTDLDNNKVGFRGIARDVSERRDIEAQLHQARKMDSIGTLAGGIAHDFNNILSIIIGNTEIALDAVPAWNPAHSNLKEIKTASLRATNIVRQILAFSRKTDQKLQPLEIAIVIKDALRFMRSMIPATIDIHQDIQTTDEAVLADPTQINQIMMNLCINASHAMELTGGNLTVHVDTVILDNNSVNDYPDLRSGKHVKVAVSDTGPGIDPAIIDRIFDPYFTTKEVGKGSGMGLAVVQGIVKNLGGAISVDSRPGEGTTFTMLFPLAEGKIVVETEAIQKLPGGDETILFVDDELSIAKMVRKMLERLGYKVETALTPQDALERFRLNADQFDLVITDMTMPQMTGVNLSEKIMEFRKDIPIIICTGYSALVDEAKAKELGLAAYVMKPINMSELAQTIRKVLDL